MASKVNILQNIAKRGYAVAPQTAACLGKLEVSTLSNKAVVASLGCGPKSLVKVAVAFRAGSRYENPENFGVSHVLRSSAGLTTACASSFIIQRSLQQIGANLTTVSDRETLVYILESTCNNVSEGLEILRKAITGQEFRPWELSDNIPRILAELATLPPQAKVLDLIHRAAFRTGLGNSVFARSFNVKKIGSETIQHYASSNLVAEKAAITGCGLPHSNLSAFAESLDLKTGSGGNPSPSKYAGGEVRVDETLPHVHTIVAAEAPGLNSPDVLPYAVLRFALGAGPAIIRGVGSSPLSKISGECSAAQALSIAHSDAGLFGIYVAAKPTEAKQAVEAAVKILKGGVTDQDVNRGKAQLKSAILQAADSCQGIVEDLAGQSLLAGTPKIASDLAEEVSKVSTQQVQQALQKIISGRKSLAAIGNTGHVPYLDEL
uniref:Ubiquinol-cytochrome c reductase complex core protein n=1 Tax=Riptortus pedestris TaxID=329032 RepID=R4WDI2_RIPPE|nr:ubiquinol-cytochrome c reductase complex core protein [Riptortus pedestris]